MNGCRKLPAGIVCLLPLFLPVLPVADAAIIQPNSIAVSVPSGSNDPTSPYTDDVLLDQLVFGSVRYRRLDNALRAVMYAKVYYQRTGVNADFGDNDDGDDGNPNPFVAAGLISPTETLTDALRESTVPSIQDAAIRAALATFSLSQGVDGENTDYGIDLLFSQGVRDDRPNRSDRTPELVFFERGANSSFTVRAILGGTLDNPLVSDAITISSTMLWQTSFQINTIEIDEGQALGAIAIDASDFTLNGVSIGNAIVYGVRITSTDTSGADIFGVFALSNNPNRFSDLPAGMGVPEPAPAATLALGLGLLALCAIRRKRLLPRPAMGAGSRACGRDTGRAGAVRCAGRGGPTSA